MQIIKNFHDIISNDASIQIETKRKAYLLIKIAEKMMFNETLYYEQIDALPIEESIDKGKVRSLVHQTFRCNAVSNSRV